MIDSYLLHHRGNSRRDRQGATLLLVVICLVVFTMLFSVMLRSTLLANHQLKQQRNQIQATWLAESGVERAVATLQQDADYSKEVWQVSPAELQSKSSGVVEIEVKRVDENRVSVNVLASYPAESKFTVKARKNIFVDQPSARSQ